MTLTQALASSVLLLVLLASVPLAVIFEIMVRTKTKRERQVQENLDSAVAHINEIAEATRRQVRLLARRVF